MSNDPEKIPRLMVAVCRSTVAREQMQAQMDLLKEVASCSNPHLDALIRSDRVTLPALHQAVRDEALIRALRFAHSGSRTNLWA